MLNMVEGSTAGEGSVGCLLLCSEGVGIGPVPQSGSLLRLSREISLMSKLSKRQTEWSASVNIISSAEHFAWLVCA